ncbi:MAG: bifunctional enoyl-CoA hydratase/phosphate acetyltransferase [Gammaproteobacteria bacterium]|nr:bifunctional enoyl-CoA hydratase/phosphate acetyltransferase [Gammaproteobacteria bacterium]
MNEDHFSVITKRNQTIIDKAQNIKQDFVVGIVTPTTSESLGAVAKAFAEKLIRPIIYGPVTEIRKVAKNLNIDVSKIDFIDIKTKADAAKKVVADAAAGKLNALMKGDIHTDLLMHEVVSREGGLRTNRRISHTTVLDVPTYEKLMIFSDAAINIAPDLLTKKDIVQNAIDFAHALGILHPNVALLSFVENVMASSQDSMNSAMLCKMAERGQIKGGILDGPISIDLAVSKAAMQDKRFNRILPELPDIFIAPDINAANIGIKILDYFANAQSSGIVVGTKVPVVLMRRSSPPVEHHISCALAKIYANWLANNQ